MESSLDEPGKFASSGMYIVDPEYEKKKHSKCSKRWCLLLIVLLIIAVVVGATFGILKVIQSSESSGQYQSRCLASSSILGLFNSGYRTRCRRISTKSFKTMSSLKTSVCFLVKV